MALKKFATSIYVQGKLDVSIYIDGIDAEDNFSALKKAVSKVYTSGEFSPRVCAMLKEAAKNYSEDFHSGYVKRNGMKVNAWTFEHKPDDESK